jgi:pSer/pThr/pTyr-binding forkhead associated (FHA) protein
MNAVILLALRILIVVVLYVFLGRAIWLLWKSITSQQETKTNEIISPLRLSSTLLGDQSAKSFTLPEVIIGRDPSCDFVLPHELISARHGRFSFHQNQWWYEDLKSTNGSYLEDLRIEEPIVVKDGDVLFCSEVDVSINIQVKS